MPLLIIFTACSDDDPVMEDTGLIGKWKLSEQLTDPGDGSGIFRSVNSDKVLEFFTDGKVCSTDHLCSLDPNADDGNCDTYTFTDDEGEINLTGCGFHPAMAGLSFEIINGDLVVYYPCIEPCAELYKKISAK